MVVLRILAQILIAASLMLLGADAVLSLKQGSIELTSLDEFCTLIRITSPDAALRAWETGGFFRDGLLYLVAAPAWAHFGFFGVLLALAVGTDRD